MACYQMRIGGCRLGIRILLVSPSSSPFCIGSLSGACPLKDLGRTINNEPHGFVESPGIRIAFEYPEHDFSIAPGLEQTLRLLHESGPNAVTPVVRCNVDSPDLACATGIEV
jgi:hypothetical protein